MVLALVTSSLWAGAFVLAEPADPPRQHVETISSASHEYIIDMGGTMDGPSTRDPIGYAAWDQVFEPNRVAIPGGGQSEQAFTLQAP